MTEFAGFAEVEENEVPMVINNSVPKSTKL